MSGYRCARRGWTLGPKNGTITIPAQLRRKFGLDKPGAQVEIIVRDGEIVLVPHVAIPAEDAWFWTVEWQAKEREVDEELAAGKRLHFQNGEEFLAYLEGLDEEGDSEG